MSENTNLIAGANLAGAGVSFVNFEQMTQTEKLEIQRDLMRTQVAIYYASLPILESRNVLNVPITLVDAKFATIQDKGQDKAVINFLCRNQETGAEFVVTKGSNFYNDSYVEYFEVRRGVVEQPLFDYEFVEDKNAGNAQNAAIVLRRIQKDVKADTANKGGK